MKLLNRILIIMLILMIPSVAIASAANIMTRLPDLYSYEFTKSQVPAEIGLDADPSELAELFSDYLTGGVSEFQIVAEYQGREKEVFTTEEQIGMQKIKGILNAALAAAAAMTVLSVLIIYYFVGRRQKERVRNAYKLSLLCFLIAWAVLIIAGMSGMGTILFQERIFEGGFDAEGVLAMLLSGGFAQKWLFFNVLGSGIIIGVIGTIIYKFTKERRMFVA